MNTTSPLKKFKNERTCEQTLTYMKHLVEAGVDMFDVDLGCYDNWWLPHPPSSMPSGCFLDIAEIVKKYFAENNIKANSKSNSQDTESSKISSDSTGKQYKLEETGILTKNSDIDWNQAKNTVEKIYTSLYSMTIDLYKTSTNQENIVNFNKEYDNLTKAVKEEKTEQSKKEKPTGKVRSWTKLPTHRKSHIHSMYVPVINALRLQSPTRYGRPMTARVRTTISSIRNSASKTANSTADLRTWE